jgi:hypothetical protein
MKAASTLHIVSTATLLFSLGACVSFTATAVTTPTTDSTTPAASAPPRPLAATGTPSLAGLSALGSTAEENQVPIQGLPKDITDFILALPPADFHATPEAWRQLVYQSVGRMLEIPRIPGRPDRRISVVAPVESALWIRTFESEIPGITGYLVQAQIGCSLLHKKPDQPPETAAHCSQYPHNYRSSFDSGLRVYLKMADHSIKDVTAQLTPPEQVMGADTLKGYGQRGSGDQPFLDGSRLDTLPVARWIVESDPDNPLPKDAYTFDGGYLAHAGFLLWNGDHFETRATVPAALWPCPSERPSCLEDDRFVTKP